MKKELIDDLRCPNCGLKFELVCELHDKDLEEVREGLLTCERCSSKFSIRNYIPRFVPYAEYVDSFGYQWNIHKKTQIDKFNGTNITANRFLGRPVGIWTKLKIIEF